jgi:hypothetical protein
MNIPMGNDEMGGDVGAVDPGATPKSKVQEIIDRISGDLEELKAAAAEEETPQGEQEELPPEGNMAEEPAPEGEPGASVPYKKKPAGNVMSFLNGKK